MKTSSLKMHKYVWALLAVFTAFVGSFPLAMMRVSQTEKFAEQHVKSLTCTGQIPDRQMVIKSTSCTQLNIISTRQ